ELVLVVFCGLRLVKKHHRRTGHYCCGRSTATSSCISCTRCKTTSRKASVEHIARHKQAAEAELGGCGILGVGIWLAVTQGNFATLSSSFPSLSAANLLIVTGTFVMIIGFVGCIGAIKENKCLLLSVSIKPLCFCSDCCLKTPVLFQGMLQRPVFQQKLPT
uniref:Tetraspanin 4 n=1 Tax=Anser brachyrhynchus TaxID=132585 RepID=A0A8B9I7Y4_9AVES